MCDNLNLSASKIPFAELGVKETIESERSLAFHIFSVGNLQTYRFTDFSPLPPTPTPTPAVLLVRYYQIVLKILLRFFTFPACRTLGFLLPLVCTSTFHLWLVFLVLSFLWRTPCIVLLNPKLFYLPVSYHTLLPHFLQLGSCHFPSFCVVFWHPAWLRYRQLKFFF